jgi:prepilin-type N-terminal cleavage/methylation domain-containing protein
VNGGFTLIEMVVVILIAAIMARVAVSTLSSLSSTRGRAAARQLLRDVTYARQWAIATGTDTWVVFNTGARTWTVMAENLASPGRSGASTMTDPATGKSFVVTINANEYAGITFTSVNIGSGVEIGFDWRGKPYINDATALASQGSVVFSNGSSVTIEAVTGYATYVP